MADAFEDRSDRLFGREVDIRHLSDRAMHSGLTAVVARPLMGKTWTLSEMARRLSAENSYLFGYHESKAAESSHLLHTVSNLYARWLADSTMREQAISEWERHKHSLVPRIGQMFGTLIKKLTENLLPEGVAKPVSDAFEDLAARRWIEAKLKAQEVLTAAQAGLAECAGELEPAYRAQVEAAVAEVTAALATEQPATKTGDLARLKSAHAALDTATQPLADVLMDKAMEAMLRQRGAIG